MAKTLSIVTLIVCLATVVACSDDPMSPPPPSPFQQLTTCEAVVNNIEVGWNQRRTDKIDELLDESFVFYFAPGDVGGEIPPSWDRAAELATTEALFVSNTSEYTTGPVCKSVRVNLDNDELTWAPVPVPTSASGEVWHRTTVFYSFAFEMEPDNTYIAVSGAKVELTVREVEGGWRLVECRDITDSVVKDAYAASDKATSWGPIKALYDESRAGLATPLQSPSRTSESTLGSIKALYR